MPYSVNESLRKLNIENFFSSWTIDGKSLNPIKINDGFYYSMEKETSGVFKNTSNIFVIEGIFKGENAVYSVAIQCRTKDNNKYEDAMIKWLESFEIKD